MVLVKGKTIIAGHLNENILSIGVAQCGPSEEFNQDIGTQIAEGRAKNRPFSQIKINNMQNVLQRFETAAATVVGYFEQMPSKTKKWQQKSLRKVS